MRVHPVSLVATVMLLLTISVSVNVLQAQKIRSLASKPPQQSALLGRKLSSLVGVSLEGRPLKVELQGAVPTVMYYFSSTCSWCEQNWQNLETVVRAADGRYQVLAITKEKDLKDFVRDRALKVTVIEQLTGEVAETLDLGSTPRTIAIGSGGIVTHDWVGVYTGRVGRQIEELFGIDMPGLSPVTSTKVR